MDYYKILGVKEDASLAQIEQAYKDLSSFYNPENNVSKLAYKRYREIEKAYKVLKEEKQRELYSLSIKNGFEKIRVSDDSNKIDIKEFENIEVSKKAINEYSDVLLDDVYSGYLHLSYNVPYLYYLVGSSYKVNFYREKIVSSSGVCSHCLGLGKLKKDEKIVSCVYCQGSGKEVTTSKELVEIDVVVDDRVILEDYKVVIEFEFNDKENYIVTGNQIEYKKDVSEKEFYNGFELLLKRNDQELKIVKNTFSVLNETYVFLDKVNSVEYVLNKYKGKDLEGYLVSSAKVVYMNPKDYTFSESSSNIYTYRLDLNDTLLKVPNLGGKGFNDVNGDLVINVIKLENNSCFKILFDRKIKKVSASLFKFKGEYNGHYFDNKNSFSYDNEFIYVPSLAYRLKIKHFTLFKIIFSLLLPLLPIVLWLIFGFGYTFFIASFICEILVAVCINLLMEVKM